MSPLDPTTWPLRLVIAFVLFGLVTTGFGYFNPEPRYFHDGLFCLVIACVLPAAKLWSIRHAQRS